MTRTRLKNLALTLAFTASGAASAIDFYNKGNEPGRPFSLAVRAGDYVFVSGQLGTGPNGLVKGFDAQARQAMDNIVTILKGYNLGMNDVVKCTIMIADMAKWDDFNKVYITYFKPERLPARSAFGANALALGGEVEVECMAYSPRR